MKSTCGQELYWLGCYKQSYDLWHPDAYSHPAKMSVPLAYKIMEHLKQLGLLNEGETILDPMCGISTTGVVAGALGHPFIGVELESKFVELSLKNKDYAERRLFKTLDWTILQGDSRRLSELLKEKGMVSVTSPPYENLDPAQTHMTTKDRVNPDHPYYRPSWVRKFAEGYGESKRGYGTTEGQIGNMRDAPLKAITSPPFGDMNHPTNYLGEQKKESCSEYSDNPENIGNLKDRPLKSILSPPYADVEKRDRTKEPSHEKEKDYPRGDHNLDGGYQGSPDNIGVLPDKPLKSILSPPYESNAQAGKSSDEAWQYLDKKYSSRPNTKSRNGESLGIVEGYGETEGQIGKEQAESYLEAMKIIYEQIALVSDCLVVVVKNPTRAGKLRRLDLDTISILEQSGWSIHCQHRALLFEELEQSTLFGEVKKKVKGRMSFFKRLSWQAGSPVANFEDIIVAVRK